MADRFHTCQSRYLPWQTTRSIYDRAPVSAPSETENTSE